ncbi:hypothetical protein POJ06DRAFT_241230 [Lipomyces tetrasporus]|uniref:Uncharacterized protein n=1 Tax=Lipomyces tetrasporus TaxID=54092 RepID=A0AAD7QL39_9ASCO|nr:uncharacterized protein POJ06DRAFT_241230 [Lipomyces tetrasporus]KAJ8097231.1 hypothetical protein POJ06DRAFT_241230 [Lipomyces tetrasporus]
MSRLFPHTAYAEDQPYYKTILASHVLYRGFQTGSALGMVIGLSRSLLGPVLGGKATSPFKNGAFIFSAVQRSTGVGAVIGTGMLAVTLPMLMMGKEEIEWKDRSWRLLENQGQMEVDDWSLTGAVAGAAIMTVHSQSGELRRWRTVVGGSGIGSLAGVIGYLVWRYGIHGGKRQ